MKNLQIIMVKDCNHMFVSFPGSMKYTHETFFLKKKCSKKWQKMAGFLWASRHNHGYNILLMTIRYYSHLNSDKMIEVTGKCHHRK